MILHSYLSDHPTYPSDLAIILWHNVWVRPAPQSIAYYDDDDDDDDENDDDDDDDDGWQIVGATRPPIHCSLI